MGRNLNNYYTKGVDSLDKYNFPLEPLIKNFSFYEFCSHPGEEDYGGFLVITNRQYVVGYNSSMGSGSHANAFARVMKDLSGGGYINDSLEVIILERELESKYVTARILYEPYYDGSEERIKRAGGIVFIFAGFLGNKKINYEQYENFLKFYDKYNEEIKYVCKKYKFTVNYTYIDDNNMVQTNVSNNLENVLKFMANNLIEKKEDMDEVIINNDFKKGVNKWKRI